MTSRIFFIFIALVFTLAFTETASASGALREADQPTTLYNPLAPRGGPDPFEDFNTPDLVLPRENDPEWMTPDLARLRTWHMIRFFYSYLKTKMPRDPDVRERTIETYQKLWNIGMSHQLGYPEPAYQESEIDDSIFEEKTPDPTPAWGFSDTSGDGGRMESLATKFARFGSFIVIVLVAGVFIFSINAFFQGRRSR